ncbi:hypothetical protein KSP40_PGU002127 [Platanthera guangdongensis]|uniref:Uncharacterized protein n=1 Tax=Platanthera guangdongensis TaxID=2320717 RepID=A0ABR2LES0_9ASPA
MGQRSSAIIAMDGAAERLLSIANSAIIAMAEETSNMAEEKRRSLPLPPLADARSRRPLTTMATLALKS